MLLDQFCALVAREPPRQRKRWLAAQRRASARPVVQKSVRRPPPRWTYAVVVGGKIVSVR